MFLSLQFERDIIGWHTDGLGRALHGGKCCFRVTTIQGLVFSAVDFEIWFHPCRQCGLTPSRRFLNHPLYEWQCEVELSRDRDPLVTIFGTIEHLFFIKTFSGLFTLFSWALLLFLPQFHKYICSLWFVFHLFLSPCLPWKCPPCHSCPLSPDHFTTFPDFQISWSFAPATLTSISFSLSSNGNYFLFLQSSSSYVLSPSLTQEQWTELKVQNPFDFLFFSLWPTVIIAKS